jgi:hypothetical protein
VVPREAPRAPRHVCGEGLSEAERLHGYDQSLRQELAELRAAVAALTAAPPQPAPILAPRALPAPSHRIRRQRAAGRK